MDNVFTKVLASSGKSPWFFAERTSTYSTVNAIQQTVTNRLLLESGRSRMTKWGVWSHETGILSRLCPLRDVLLQANVLIL